MKNLIIFYPSSACVDHGGCVNGNYDENPEKCNCICDGGWSGVFCHREYKLPC